jgi:hypothetical protein
MADLYKLLYERVSMDDVIKVADGVNGLIAVTKSNIYLVRGKLLEKKLVKTYGIKNISSIEIRKPGLMFNGHFQIITSGNQDKTKRNSSTFDYVKDENTVMIRGNFDEFLEVEKLIYQFRDDLNETKSTEGTSNDDVITKIEKLARLKEQNIITEEEFELKKKDLLEKL